MVLDQTTKTLEVLLGGAPATNQLPVVASWGDLSATAITPGSADTVTNGVTAVTIVAAPAASVQRQVRSIHIYNADTASVVVTVRLNNNATLRILVKATLAPGDSLVYEWGRGWFRVPNEFGASAAQFEDGSVSNPSITFIQDTDTGLYRPSADTIGVATAGVQRLQIDSAMLGLASGMVARMLSQNRFRHLNSMVQARRTASQSIPDVTETAIAFTAADDFDTDALHDIATNNNRLTAAIAGKHLIWGFSSWASGAGTYRAIFIYNQAATLMVASKIPPVTGGASMYVPAPTGVANLAVGDWVEMKVMQNTGGNLGTGVVVFGMAYIGE